MARFLKIPQFFGQQPTDILYYNSKCQYESIEYLKRIKTINGVKALAFDGDTDYAVARFKQGASGWNPQMGSTFFMKFMIPSGTNMYAKDFGIFGSGTSQDLNNRKEFWGLHVRTDQSTGSKVFYLTLSDRLQILETPFRGYSFSPITFPEGQFNSLVLVQNAAYAELYVNGEYVAKTTFSNFTPKTSDVYSNIYVGQYGLTNEYAGMQMYLSEIGLWERPLEARDIADLHQTRLVENKSVNSTAKRIKIDAGKFYYDGYLHSIDSTSLYIDGVGKESIYILITEKLVTEEEDSDLYDNSTNTYNLGKPGMHRIKYEYSYGINVDTSNLPSGTYAVKFLEYIDGEKTFSLADANKKEETISNENTQVTDAVSELGGRRVQEPTTTSEVLATISKYFYEALGNFIFSGLPVSLIDKDLSTYQISVGKGVYYLNGYRYEVDSNIQLDVSKTSSLATIVNEYFKADSDIITFAQQPVAAKYNTGKEQVSGITRVMVPAIKSTTINPTNRSDPHGEDIIPTTQGSPIKVLKVSRSNGLDVFIPCTAKDSSDGDYFFYNGRIKWSQQSSHIPDVSSGGSTGYQVEYVALLPLSEKDGHFSVIKGDRTTSDERVFKGKNVLDTLSYEPAHIISITVTPKDGFSSSHTISSSKLDITKNEFMFTDDTNMVPGDHVTIFYSYNSKSTTPVWNLVLNSPEPIDKTSEGFMDYKYWLTDIYTLAIDNDNVFRLYRGTPGQGNDVVRASVPDTSLPVADIIIDPDNAKNCRITPYNIYKAQVLDTRNLMKKVKKLEDNIAMSELEKSGEAKTDISNLRGMYVDALSNYTRANLDYFDAYIDLFAERLYSGYISTAKQLELENTDNVTIGRETYFPLKSYRNAVIDYQHSITGEDNVNKLMQSKAKATVEVYGDFSYLQDRENDSNTKNMILSTALSKYTLIPYNADTSVFNVSSMSGSGNSEDYSYVIKNALEKYSSLFNDSSINTKTDTRHIVIVGRGFSANENNIVPYLNGTPLYSEYMTALNITKGSNGDSFVNVLDMFNKNIHIEPLAFASGWTIDKNNSIVCNDKGEFVICLEINRAKNVVTGIHDLTFKRMHYPEEPVSVNINLCGLIDSLKNVIQTNSRGNITFYDCPKYCKDFVPSIIQPISSTTATLTGLNLYFTYIDYSMPMAVDLYELDGTNIKSVVYRKYITSAQDFKTISGNKYTVEFEYPVNVINSKSYAIGICTENSSIRFQVSELGKPSTSQEDMNVIVSKLKPFYTVLSSNNGALQTSNDGKKGMAYDLNAIDISNNPKSATGYIENYIKFDTIDFGEKNEQRMFTLLCDIDPTIGFDRKISIEYSIDSESTPDDTKKWTKLTPYTLTTPKEKFRYLTIRFTIATGNVNYLSSIPQYPIVKAFKFKPESAYYSKFFLSGLSESEADTNKLKVANIYINGNKRPYSDYKVCVSSDSGISWHECEKGGDKLVGRAGDLEIIEHKYTYPFRLNHPVFIGHEFKPSTNGGFPVNTNAEYVVVLLDKASSNLRPGKVYSYSRVQSPDTPGKYEDMESIYAVRISQDNVDASDPNTKFDIHLKIEADPNAKGFMVYRRAKYGTTSEEKFSLIYNSIASTTVGNITKYKSDVLPLADISEFPSSGIVQVNNELIKYEVLDVENKSLTKLTRHFGNTLEVEYQSGNEVKLCDYCTEHENPAKGQMPKIYSSKPYFLFIDDNYTYRPAAEGAIATADEVLTLLKSNDTYTYPEYCAVKIKFDTSEEATESSGVWNMICNIEEPQI